MAKKPQDRTTFTQIQVRPETKERAHELARIIGATVGVESIDLYAAVNTAIEEAIARRVKK